MAAAGAFTVFLTAPMSVVAANVSDFQHLDAPLAVLVSVGVAAVAALVAAGVAFLLLKWSAVRPVVVALIRFGFFFVLLTTLFLPLAVSAGQVEIKDIPVDKTNFAIAVAGALALAAVLYTRLRGIVLTVASFALIGSTAIAAFTVLTAIKAPEAQANTLYEASSTDNIFVLSFDGVPRDVALEVLAENPELQPAFKDFVVFDQVISSAPATFTSLTSETSGIANLKALGETESDLFNHVLDKGANIPTILSSNGYKVSTYSSYNYTLADLAGRHEMGSMTDVVALGTRVDRAFEVLDYGLARALSGRVAVTRNAARLVGNALSGGDVLQARVLSHKGRDWDVSSILTVLDLESYLDRLDTTTDQAVAQFLHFTHTHFPVDFDRDCVYRSDDADWYNRSQNREALKEQTYCAMTQFGAFIERLKTIGVYDTSLIVLKSDHGEPVDWMDGDRYEGFPVRQHEYWGFGRYMPFLAIKDRGRETAQYTVDSRHVALSDLANTLCRAAIEDKVDCNALGSINLLGADPVPPDATYFVYIVRDAAANFRLDTHEAIELPRNRRFEEALNDYLTDEMVAGSVACDTDIALQSTANQEAPAVGPWVRWTESGTTYVKFAPADCSAQTVEVRMRLAEGVAPDAVSVLLDGREAAYSILAQAGSDLTVALALDAASTRRVVAVSDGSGGPVALESAVFRATRN